MAEPVLEDDNPLSAEAVVTVTQLMLGGVLQATGVLPAAYKPAGKSVE